MTVIQPARFVMLLSEGFGGNGGIAKFNADFIEALAAAPQVAGVDALPRLAPAPLDRPAPAGVTYDIGAARGAGAFLRRVLRRMLAPAAIDVVVCGHIHLLPAAWLLARLRGAKLALIVHGYEAWAPGRLMARPLARRIDALLAVSNVSAERFGSWAGLPALRFVLPNAVDPDRFTPGPRDAALTGRYRLGAGPVLMTLGRMAAHERVQGFDKGFDRIIELMPRLLARHPDLTYLVVGEGDDRPRLMRKAEALGLGDRVVFTGSVPEADKVAHYRLADVFALPSHGEGFGIVLIEAVACGLGVVGSCRDGSREALLDGELGQLVDPDDDAALLAALETALGAPRSRNPRIAQFSHAAFRQRVALWSGAVLARPQRGSALARRVTP